MTVCKKCNGTGEITVPVEEHLGTVLYGTEQCDECDGTGEVLTNEDWFCQLSTEGKAEKFVILCKNAFGAENYRNKHWKDYQNIDYWKAWLKQPHKKE